MTEFENIFDGTFSPFVLFVSGMYISDLVDCMNGHLERACVICK